MQNKWFDNYRGEEVIVMDDMDRRNDYELGHLLKRWTDHYKVTAEVKGGVVGLCHKKFIVTSNWKPEELWDDQKFVSAIRRRFEVIEIVKL